MREDVVVAWLRDARRWITAADNGWMTLGAGVKGAMESLGHAREALDD